MNNMTKEQYEEIEKEIETKMQQLKDDLRRARDQYIAAYPFKEGEKVRVSWEVKGFNEPTETKTIDCFIGSVDFKYGEIYLSFNKIKKDGTMSGQSAGIYYNSHLKIEKID